MSLEDLHDRLDAALPQLASLSAVIKFDLGEDGSWLVDTRSSNPSLRQEDGEESGEDADCTVIISSKNLVKLLDGSMDPMLAYGMGRIKVRGSMGLAMKLVTALG
ncbi:MAG TPA: SCP2 sterol-binding domain-containing protein [Candidatus Sulfotelmatobacter sp.]|jgi:putative sterol carrier protein|nr:SCP2 sterol-binding domain-containing protein [Candidatus Sulfotelmatobacter sp.]